MITIGRFLESQGIRVTYIAGQTNRTDLKRLASLGPTRQWQFNSNRGRLTTGLTKPTIDRIINDYGPFDIIHVQAPYNPFGSHRFIKSLPQTTKVVASLHVLPAGRLATIGLKTIPLLIGSSLKRVDLFLANSAPTAEFYESSWRIKTEPLANPLVVDHFRQAKRRPGRRPKRTIVFLGRLVKRKGAADLVRAFSLLDQKQRRQTRLLIAGRGPQIKAIRRLISQNGLDDSVDLKGFIDESMKAQFLANADLIVMPSTGGESFGISLTESLASGRSLVLAAANPGYSSILGGLPKQMFAPAQPASLAACLDYWLKAKSDRWQAAIKAQTEIVNVYDINRSIGPRLIGFYNDLVGRRDPETENPQSRK